MEGEPSHYRDFAFNGNFFRQKFLRVKYYRTNKKFYLLVLAYI